jgi:branched-chain amino acid transport system permease protein
MGREVEALLRSPATWAVLLAVLSLPFWMSSYHLGIAVLTLFYVAMALAWNIIGGIGGQISLAQSLFVGTGAMLASALQVRWGVNLWFGLAISAAVAALIGVFTAFVDSRFRLGHLSFALVTLAFAEIGELVVTGTDFFGGASGLSLPRDRGNFLALELGGTAGYFWAALLTALAGLVLNYAVLNRPLGYFLRSLRDNEQAAQAIGIEVFRNKAIATAISAALSSVVGTFYARYLTFVDPYLLASPVLTIEIVLIATIGGLGTPLGPLFAAALLVPFGEIIRGQLGGVLPGLHYFLYGVLIVVVITTSPQGIVPRLAELISRLRLSRAPRPATRG